MDRRRKERRKPKRAAYYQEHKEEIRSKTKAYILQNPELIRSQKAAQRAKPEARALAAQCSREWHAENRDYANRRRKMRKQNERISYPWKGPLDAARTRAKNKGLPFDLTDEWAAARWTGRCEISDIPFKIGERGTGPKFFSASIDQIIPKGGYTQDNTRFVLWCVNAFKYDGTDSDMFFVAEAIIKNRVNILPPPA